MGPRSLLQIGGLVTLPVLLGVVTLTQTCEGTNVTEKVPMVHFQGALVISPAEKYGATSLEEIPAFRTCSSTGRVVQWRFGACPRFRTTRAFSHCELPAMKFARGEMFFALAESAASCGVLFTLHGVPMGPLETTTGNWTEPKVLTTIKIPQLDSCVLYAGREYVLEGTVAPDHQLKGILVTPQFSVFRASDGKTLACGETDIAIT